MSSWPCSHSAEHHWNYKLVTTCLRGIVQLSAMLSSGELQAFITFLKPQ